METVESWYLVVSQGAPNYQEFTRCSILVRLLGWSQDRCPESFLVKFPSQATSQARSQAKSQARFPVRFQYNTQDSIQDTYLSSLLQVCFYHLPVKSPHLESPTPSSANRKLLRVPLQSNLFHLPNHLQRTLKISKKKTFSHCLQARH